MFSKDYFRRKLLKYTRKAFFKLPDIENPKILDLGCGTGVPTLELARISRGQITALDNHQESLDQLNQKISQLKLENRLKTVNSSLSHLNFPEESFDIIWAEGSIFAVGFGTGLKEWRPLIKKQGFLVVHDDYQDHRHKLQLIRKCGYQLLDSFLISHEIWWSEYYQPLEKQIQELQIKGVTDFELQIILKKEEDEIKWFKAHESSSVFYVMQKTSSDPTFEYSKTGN
jgi:ubiquinone/menaquinone biosynthesis C-methylase UbiE